MLTIEPCSFFIYSFREFLTGFHKRRLQRQKAAQAIIEAKLKKASAEARAKVCFH